ncbi:MAG: LLM class flavin-dependent oxidoreductase [Acidimicrobiia bacterium]|nr:LLM class flavin-dependent oxidoreductase [Acidimicrobiia bacterium]
MPDVGIAMGPTPPFDAMARRVSRLAASGLRSFWWPDHLVAFHSAELWATGGLGRIQPDPHVYADPFVCMAVSAGAAGDALVGVCVTDAIRRNAATLAQTVLSLDHLAPGRVVLGLGSGEYANYGPYGVEVPSPARVLDEAAARIRRLLDDPGPDEQGAVMGLRPPEGSPGPRLWLAAHGPRGFRTAGRYGDGWIPNFLTVDAWHAGKEAVASAAAEAGRDPSALTYGLSVQVVLQDDHEAAHRLLEHPVLKAFALLLPPERYEAVGASHPLGGGGLHHMVASRAGADQLRAAEAVPFEVVHDQMLHGTPEEVAEQIGRYRGLDHVVLWDPVPLADLDAARSAAAGCVRLAALLQEET